MNKEQPIQCGWKVCPKCEAKHWDVWPLCAECYYGEPNLNFTK